MLTDEDKVKLSLGYLDPHKKSWEERVTRDRILLWLDAHLVLADGRCYSKHVEADADVGGHGAVWSVITSATRWGLCFQYADAVALLRSAASSKLHSPSELSSKGGYWTFMSVHSNVNASAVAFSSESPRDYLKCNGGMMLRRRKLEEGKQEGKVHGSNEDEGREYEGDGDGSELRTPSQEYCITCRVAVENTVQFSGFAPFLHELLVYGRVLDYDEIFTVQSYLSEKWAVQLEYLDKDQVLLERKRLEFLSTFSLRKFVSFVHYIRMVFFVTYSY